MICRTIKMTSSFFVADKESIEKLKKNLTEKHENVCKWSSNPTPGKKLAIYYPPPKVGRYRFGVFPSGCSPIRPDVRPSQTCWGYISKTITDLNKKL